MNSTVSASETVLIDHQELALTSKPTAAPEELLTVHINDGLTTLSVTRAELSDAARFFFETGRKGTDLLSRTDLSRHDAGHMRETSYLSVASQNYGYEFVLVKSRAGNGIFGVPRAQFAMFRSVLGKGKYAFLGARDGLAKALQELENMYFNAARLHLA